MSSRNLLKAPRVQSTIPIGGFSGGSGKESGKDERKGQALHGRVEADAANQCKIGSLSDLPFVVHADSKAPEKTAASAGPSQGDLRAAGVAPRRTLRDERATNWRTAPVACGREMNDGS